MPTCTAKLSATTSDVSSDMNSKYKYKYKYKYYAIWKGRHANNCIFFSWEDASVHIEGYDDDDDDDDEVVFQGFDNLMEASDFLTQRSSAHDEKKKQSNTSSEETKENTTIYNTTTDVSISTTTTTNASKTTSKVVQTTPTPTVAPATTKTNAPAPPPAPASTATNSSTNESSTQINSMSRPQPYPQIYPYPYPYPQPSYPPPSVSVLLNYANAMRMRDNANADADASAATLVSALSRLSQSTQSNNDDVSAATATATAAMASTTSAAAAAGMSNSATAMATAAAKTAGMVANAAAAQQQVQQQQAQAVGMTAMAANANANHANFARRSVTNNPRPLPLSLSAPTNSTSPSRKRDGNNMNASSSIVGSNGITSNKKKKTRTHANLNKAWLSSFENLKRYKEETGSFDFPTTAEFEKQVRDASTCSDDSNANGEKEGEHGKISKCAKKLQKLKRWVAEQKHHYRNYRLGKESTTMSEEKLRRFSEIGFQFSDDLTQPKRGRKPVPDSVKAATAAAKAISEAAAVQQQQQAQAQAVGMTATAANANANHANFARRSVRNPRPLPLSLSTSTNASTNSTSPSRKRDRNNIAQEVSPPFNLNAGVGMGVGMGVSVGVGTTMNRLNANSNGNANMNTNGNMNASSSIEGSNGINKKKKTTHANLNKRWLSSFENLKRYKEETGSFDFPTTAEFEKQRDASGDSNANGEKEGENGMDSAADGEISKCAKKLQKLKRWVAEQKHNYRIYRLGKESTMSEEKLRRFSEIGFQFSDDLTQPKRGRKPVPDSVKAATAAAKAISDAAKKARGETIRSKEKWEKMYAVLKAYHAIHGNCDVPRPPRKAKGEKISSANDNENDDDDDDDHNDNHNGAESDSDTDSDNRCAEKGVDSSGVNSDLNPTAKPTNSTSASVKKTPAGKVDDGHNRALYTWITAQRYECRKLRKGKPSKMTAHRMLKLNELGFNFRLNLGTGYLRWPDRLEKLRKYKEKHGHLNIPISDAELGSFARRTRMDYAKYLDGNTDVAMNAERVKDLEALGFAFNNGKRRPRIVGKDGKIMAAPSMTWQERFEELLEFKEQFGHCLVPQKYESGLGHWVHRQRSNYKLLRAGKKSPMNADKALKLTEAGFVFETHRRRSRKLMEEERQREREKEQNQDQDQRQLHLSPSGMDHNLNNEHNFFMEFQK